jgi:UDP-N-acetylglucosamine--N-acetylmuramyl-(pentapeptide) pyrophosphoryl-undecaprenol N-acetylglucosamine transferase
MSKDRLIIISGGGTGGPSIVPLALAQAYKKMDHEAKFLFIGSNSDLEKKLFSDVLADLKAEYLEFPAGKWRRYFSLLNFLDIFRIIYAFFKALFLFIEIKPKLIVSAGSFASVPIVWAAKTVGVKVMIHQQDVRAGLANRLMSPVADIISTAFYKSVADYGKRALWIGNPSLETLPLQNTPSFHLDLHELAPVVFVSGGAGGALTLNRLLQSAFPYLPADWQIVHQTGKGKNVAEKPKANYYPVENLSHVDFINLIKRADLIVARAGLGSFTEFSQLAKAVILVPMPNTHQEDNASYFAEQGAAIYLKQKELDGQKLAQTLIDLWDDQKKYQSLSENIKKIMPVDASETGAKLIKDLIYESA